MVKYKDKYRVETIRHRYWNYGANAYYFVTICLADMRQHHFGKIINHKMRHSEIGEIANACWIGIPKYFPFVILHNHIIMPNHVHGVIQIAKPDGVGSSQKETQSIASLQQPANQAHVPCTNQSHMPCANQSHPPRANPSHMPRTFHTRRHRANPLRTLDLPNKNKFGPQSQNLGSIIRGFKTGVTIKARKINPKFKWQARFHDRIIRSERQFNNVQNYITNNPKKWE